MGLPHVQGFLDIPADPFDLQEARNLLDSAGYGDGIDFDYHLSDGFVATSTIFEWVNFLVADWGQVGLNANVIPQEFGTMAEMVIGKTGNGVFAMAFGILYIDPAQWGLVIFSDGLFSFVNDPVLDERMAVVRSGGDEDERSQAWTDVQQQVYDESLYPVLWYQNIVTAVNPDIDWEPVPGVGYFLGMEGASLRA